jgi:hypothetical protein
MFNEPWTVERVSEVNEVSHFLSPKENIALNLIFEWLGESRFNRTYEEYVAIAWRLPKLAALHAYVNERLRKLAAAGVAPYEICYFRSGDQYPWYEPFPVSLSITTIRTALIKSGMAQLKRLRH